MAIFVKDIMSKPVFKVEEGKNIKHAADLISKTRRGFLVVTRRGIPVGVLSDSDIIRNVVAKNLPASKTKVKSVMTRHFVSVSSDEEMITAVRKMKKGNVHRLPVIDDNKIVGVISLTDIARTSPEMLDLLEYRLKMKEEPLKTTEQHTSGVCENCGNYTDDLTEASDQWLCEDCKEEIRSEI